MRKSVQAGYADYIPIFLSETQRLYRSGVLPCDVAMIQVSLPDKHGYVSMGTSVDASLAAVECAKHVIAVVNKHVPRAWGDAIIPLSMIDTFVECDSELEPAHFSEPSDHKNLGIHTEMFADGVLPLVKKGVINGAEKCIDRGKMVSTFLMGSQEVYDFIDDNPMVAMMDVGYTNDPYVIAKNPKVTAINGGQIDFVYGASLSKGGKAIIAMPSVTNKGVSKIAPVLTSGAGVVTTRNHIHWFVTEYGAVDLYGKSLQERAKAIISVAHPDHQEELDRAAFERFGPHYHFIG